MSQFSLLHTSISKALSQELPDELLQPFYDLFVVREVNKKTLLVEEGKVARQLYFFNRGSAYLYYLNEKGEETAIQFALEGYWLTDMYSFLTGKPGLYTAETLEPCELLCIDLLSYESAMVNIPYIERFFRILIQNAFIAQQYRLAKTNSESAEHRYLEFAELYPHFIQRIPQYLIASYLGITPPSLSRIRQKLARND